MRITYDYGNAALRPLLRKIEVNEHGNELDAHIVLLGDLDLAERACGFVKSEAKYHHIVFTFDEFSCEVNDIVDGVLSEFMRLLMSAYQTDEYCCYAERHAPKVKSILDRATNQRIERPDHTHLIIPKFNLLSGEDMDLIGDMNESKRYLDAIEIHLNNMFDMDA